MARTRAELGLRMLGEYRKSRTPSGERANSRARTPKPQPPPAPAPDPLEEPAEEGAPGGVAGRGADSPLGALAPAATLLIRAPSPAATATGGPRTPQALDTASLVATAKAPGLSHAKEAFPAAAGSEGGKPTVVARPPTPRGAPNAATGAGDDDMPAAGIAAVSGGADDDIGPGAGTGTLLPASSAGEAIWGTVSMVGAEPVAGTTVPRGGPMASPTGPSAGSTVCRTGPRTGSMVSSTAPTVGPSVSPTGLTTGSSVSPTGPSRG